METITTKGFLQVLSKGGLSAALLIVLVYFGTLFVGSLNDVQKQLCSIRLELVKIQSSIISEDKIEKMIDDKIEKTILRYHSNNK